jgi:hypothetical protein
MVDTVVENLEAAILQLSNSEKNAARKALDSEGNILKKASIEIGYLQAEIDSVRFRLEAVLHLIKLYENAKR